MTATQPLALLAPDLRVDRRPDGWRMDSLTPLPEPGRCVGVWLERWARERPEQTFLAERDGSGGWRRLSYREALAAAEGVGSALLASGASATRPVMVLSDNSIDGALVQLGAMHAGVPVSPVSPAYSLLSPSLRRLEHLTGVLRPSLVFADDPVRYGPALALVARAGADVITSRPGPHRTVSELVATPRSGELERAYAALGPDSVAKVLFTSGSTGDPRGVVNTQRMLTSSQASLEACWPFLATRPPVVVDWLPWSHTFGGNHNFFLVLRQGGTLHIDRGRPVPALIDATVANLADVSPTLWFNVPRGFDQIVPRLEQDLATAERVFRRLQILFYAAAALAPSTRERLERVAARVGRPDVFFTSSWGSTETSPLATSAHFPTRTTGTLGVPVPGVSLRLVRTQDRHEIRVKGPNVTPGYWRPGGGVQPPPLDDEGFLPTGDAGRLADESDPSQGVVFVGRLSENFKLSSGTWVNVAQVRLGLVEACAPLVLDAVVAGHDRESLGALLFLSPAAASVSPADLAARLQAAIEAYNRTHTASSERVTAALVLTDPLSLDEGETTDKGYTNQRRVLDRRAADVARLFAESPDDPAVWLLPGP